VVLVLRAKKASAPPIAVAAPANKVSPKAINTLFHSKTHRFFYSQTKIKKYGSIFNDS
jgi:hypothetical protein